MILKEIKDIFSQYPKVLFGFSNIDFSEYREVYKCALIFAVPYSHKLSLENYNEKLFNKSIYDAKDVINVIVNKLRNILERNDVKYFVPPVAQKDEVELIAPFSFKFAAVNAGLGWIGKNDVVITKQNGPRQRLSDILIDYDLPCGVPITESYCPSECNKCVESCPHNALKNMKWNINSKRHEIIDYNLCNQKRSLFIKKLGRKSSCGLCLVSCPYGL